MTIDERGNVYLTGKGVSVFNPEGTKIQQIEVPKMDGECLLRRQGSQDVVHYRQQRTLIPSKWTSRESTANNWKLLFVRPPVLN